MLVTSHAFVNIRYRKANLLDLSWAIGVAAPTEPDMNNRDDESYYRMRAQREREIAVNCEDNAVALAHLKLADAYEQRLQQEPRMRVAL
jgi:hypothetical protein